MGQNDDLLCPKGCKPTRTSIGGTMGTVMAWTPIYNEKGTIVEGEDPNTYTTDYHCHQCGAHWAVSHRGNERTVSEPWWPEPIEIFDLNSTATYTSDSREHDPVHSGAVLE